MVAGALSMAAGEYVSVSSQADTEKAELDRERRELADDPEFELQELTDIYIGRGLNPQLAAGVAKELMDKDALGAHARDELGLSEVLSARPVQAAVASAGSFAVGAMLPLVTAVVAPSPPSLEIAGASLISLFALGALSAKIGGAPAMRAAGRVTFWGALAMALTAAVGTLFGLAV
jgi:VIT1/CCC1 family predicted Fe2+/Mn2+ transporter